ncbi:hypothetical protein J4230_01305 [Candidatus Woesearchaeota archaeon]|nr:hypothetical protein [Candidatus Woesearchaeota archaeon]
MKIKYDLLLKKSWMGMKNNLIVFLPLVYSIALGLVFLIMMLLEFLLFIGLLPDPRVELIRFLYFAVPIGLIDILLLILLTSVINAMYINLLNLVSRDYKATNKDLLQGIKKYAYLYFKVQMIKFSIILIPILILGLIIFLGFLISKLFGLLLVVILGLILFIYIILASLFMVFGLLFLEPIMTTIKLSSAIELIKLSFKYAKNNYTHIFITWLIMFAINFVLSIIVEFTFFSPFVILIIPIILLVIVRIVANIWLRIFLFNSYFNKNIKKL